MAELKHFLVLDFETFYSKEYTLKKMTTPEYILDDRFQVLLLAAFAAGWKGPRIIEPKDIPAFLADYPAGETVACSHNALFDMSILAWKYNWVPARLRDTLGMVRTLRNYKDNRLGSVAKELFGADTKGSTIHRVVGLDTRGIKQAGLWPEYCTYAMNDVRLCTQIYFKLAPELPAEEREVMDLVLRAAVSPVLHADVAMLQTHLDELRRRKAWLLRECNYDKAALMSTAKFKEALELLGVEVKFKTSPTGNSIPAFAKTDPFMTELAEYEEADEDTNYKVQTLAAARLSHRSTIEETRAQKFVNIARLPWGNGPLLPVALRYGGAHTHRLSGEWGLNMQNLPRDKEKSKLRAAIIAPPGNRIITADLAQIEARIVACLCGQDDLLEQFANGEDVYASFASTVFGGTVTKQTRPNERFIGKTAILGLGYGCGVDRFYQMVVTQARMSGIPLEDLFDRNLAQRIVDAYRIRFAHIPRAWKTLDRLWSFVINSRNPNQQQVWGPVVCKSGQIVLPNGLKLRYQLGDQSIYGAKLLENIVQALARIVVMQAAIRLNREGYRFALQAHDELGFVVTETDIGRAMGTIQREMVQPPSWMPDLPLAVEVGVGSSYGEAK
ncbi:MAG TPA: DNA polymerase [Nitrospiraceae bacterium]